MPAGRYAPRHKEEEVSAAGYPPRHPVSGASCATPTKPDPLSFETLDDQEEDAFAEEGTSATKNAMGTTSMFAGTPPLEAFKLMMVLWCSLQRSSANLPLKLGVYDVTKAHLYGLAEREVYVQPPEDVPISDGCCLLLLRSSYGLQDAAGIWQKTYTALLESDGWTRGAAYVACFRHESGAIMLVHGDDFAVLGDAEDHARFRRLLDTAYEYKTVGVLGPDKTDDRELSFLNRIVRYYPGSESGGSSAALAFRLEYEPDPRHAELVIQQLGLTTAKGS